jgi:methionyl-tRNA formyltransferase/MoaA/NifB/PqqE/SkfB family radical SAM enzyme
MKAVVFGLTGFGNAAVRSLKRAGWEVALVVTGAESGLFPYYAEEDLAALCRRKAIEVVESPDLNHPALRSRVDALAPELLLVATYHENVPGRFLNVLGRTSLALQPSLLPRHRGATPTSWMLIEGEKTAGVTLYLPTAKAFAGDIVLQREIAITGHDTDGTLRQRLAHLSEEAWAEALDLLSQGKPLPRRPQDDRQITFFPPRTRRDGLIKFDEPTANVHNRIRGTNPYPGAFTFHGLRELRIISSHPESEASFEVAPGLVMRAAGRGVVVKTSDGAIAIETEPSLIPELARGELVLLDDSARPLAIKKTARGNLVHTPEIVGMVAGAEEFPKMVVLATVYPCNAKCPNCPYTETNSDIRLKYADQPFIDPELFKRIARECGEHGAFVRITGGGEPMMHPADMVSLIEYARSVGARVWLNTNGSLMPPEKIDRLLGCSLDQVEFSVDAADPETYAVVRAGLDWEGLLRSVRYFVAERNRRKASTNIVVSVIEQEMVKDHMDDIARFWLELGVDEVMRRKFLTWGSNTRLDAVLSADPTPYLDKTEGEPCPYPFHRLNIDSRGKVEVCGYDISGRTNFGNVREQSIREIWKGPMFEWWRTRHLERRGGEIPLCRECPDWQYRSWTHNWEKVMRTAEKHRLHAIELTEVSTHPRADSATS